MEEAKSQHIKVWPFSLAPKKFAGLSNNGGDEDWLVLVPEVYSKYYIGWLESGSFGCCNIDEFKLDNGDVVYIGSHS